MNLTRLWKFEGDETLDDAKQMLKDAKTNNSKYPLPI